MKSISLKIKRLLAVVSLTAAYATGVFISRVTKRFGSKKGGRKRVIINGTFHNPNWFFAHIEPIVKSNYGEVILVCDEPVAELPNLRYSCPPRWLSRVISRALAKFIYTLANGIRYPADFYIGYHIFPSALTALICSRLLGAKCCYQVTSGQLEIEGGGWNSENKLLTMLGAPSNIVEKLAHKLTDEFDLVIVRGTGARNYLREAGVSAKIEIVTGSVVTNAGSEEINRDIDLIFIGRLTEYKRPDIFLAVVAKVVKKHPECTVRIVGDGPDYQHIKSVINMENMAKNVLLLGQRSDVPDLLRQTKILVMTSRWEGVSIAMLEAMAMGVVPVVSDVGDLRDYVIDDVTGYVLDMEDVDGYVEKIEYLLTAADSRNRMSKACHEKVDRSSSKSVITQKWFDLITGMYSSQ